MSMRLGDILVEHGDITAEQKELVLEEQRRSGEPFGAICERLFDIEPGAIEAAWAAQYARMTRRVDPRHEIYEDAALALVTRRQAWQFSLLPIRFDGEELMVATTQQHLCRALRFTTRFIGAPVFFVLAESKALGEALCRHYPLGGMTSSSLTDGAHARLLERARRCS